MVPRPRYWFLEQPEVPAVLSSARRWRADTKSPRWRGFLFDNVIFPLLLKKVYADKNRQEAIVRNSGLDWVLVRPSVLNDKNGRGTIRTLTDLSDFHGGTISREDVARFVLDQLRGDAWLHRSPL